jgi:hypothetical protein
MTDIQAKDLVEGLLPGNHAVLNEVVSGVLQRVRIHGKTLHNRFVPIVAQALSVTNGD